MTSAVRPSAPLAPAQPRAGADVRAPVARAILVAALLLGVAGDSLLRDGPSGVAFPLWIGVLALNGVSLVWKDGRRVGTEAGAWLAAAFVFAIGLAWRNADKLQALDVLATLACLALAAVALAEPQAALAATSARRSIAAMLRLARTALPGFVPLIGDILRDAEQKTGRAERATRWQSIARSAAIAIVLLAVFGALLRSADPIFASLVALPDFDVGEFIGHIAFSAFVAWLVAGWIRGAMRTATTWTTAADEPWLPLQLGSAEVTTALATLNVLFAAFVATQIAWVFGGERFLREHTGLTAAAYARTGFFQMVWVVALVVPVLLGTRALLRRGQSGPALARRHTALAIPLVALLGVMILSAVLRLKMYVHYFGLTTERLYPLVFMGWLAFVLAWMIGTVLRGRHGFMRGVLVSGFAVLAALNVLDPDGYVARVNVDRAAQLENSGADKLDVAHLASLHGGAVPLAIAAVLDDRRAIPNAQRCAGARTLLSRWVYRGQAIRRTTGDASWRFWNADDRLALDAVRSHARELRSVEHRTCVAVPAPARAISATPQR